MQEMKLGTSVSSASCLYPKDTHTGRSILSYSQPGMWTSLWEDVRGRVSDFCVLHAPGLWEAQCCPSKVYAFGFLLPLLSITYSSPIFVQDLFFQHPFSHRHFLLIPY